MNIDWAHCLSTQQRIVHPGGIFQFSTGQSNATVAIGLTNERANKHFSSIDHAFLLRADGTVQIYEKGAAVSTPRPYAAGNLFSLRVIVVAGLHMVAYVKNYEEFHATRNVAPRFPLVGIVLLTQNPAKIIKPVITSLNIPESDIIAPEEMEGTYLELSRIGKPINAHEEVGFNIYRSTDPDLPKDQWKRLNQTLLTETTFVDKAEELGVAYYYYQWFGQKLSGNRPITSEIFKLRMIFYRCLV